MQQLWRNPKARSIFYQAAVIAGIAWLFYAAISNALANLRQRGVSTGLSFLSNEAGISIPETPPVPSDVHWIVSIALFAVFYLACKTAIARSKLPSKTLLYLDRALVLTVLSAAMFAISSIDWIRYRPSESYYVILISGMANTISVGVVAAAGAITLGFILGICQLSTNWLLRQLVTIVTETVRNVPLLLHVLFWYGLIINALPPVRQSISIGSRIFLSNRGIFYPTIQSFDATAFGIMAVACVTGALVLFMRKLSTPFAVTLLGFSLLICTSLAADWQAPVLEGFNFVGGTSTTPEYTALLVGLVIYYSAFIADIVRSALRSIPASQWESAASLGLSRLKAIWLVVVPQALRVIVPPLSNQLLGLAKDTSIGVAVAYPEFVAISRTVINQTGQALEVMFLLMIFYLAMNLSISTALNLYNEKIRIVER